MENLSLERLLLLLAFLLLPMLNWLFGQVSKRRRPRRAVAQPAPPPIPNVPEVSAPRGEKKPLRERAAPAPLLTPLRRSRAARLRSALRRQPEVRRGIILIAVLGPCRGNEPIG